MYFFIKQIFIESLCCSKHCRCQRYSSEKGRQNLYCQEGITSKLIDNLQMNDIAATIYFMTISLVEAKFSLGHAEFEVLVPYHSISLSPKSISLTFYYLTTAFLPFHLLATSSFTLSRSLMLYFPFHLLYHAHCFSPQDQARCFGHHFSHSYLQSSYFNSLLGQFWSSLHIHIHTQTKNKNQSVNQSNKQTKKPSAISTLLSRSNMLFFFFSSIGGKHRIMMISVTIY